MILKMVALTQVRSADVVVSAQKARENAHSREPIYRKFLRNKSQSLVGMTNALFAYSSFYARTKNAFVGGATNENSNWN